MEMTATELESVVRTVLEDEFKVEPGEIHPDASLEALGLDSLDVVSFAMAVEDRFGVQIPEAELEGVRTFGDALELLGRKVSALA
jgi:acyl carrier protein